MDRRLFISAGLASLVIGTVAVFTSGVLTPSQDKSSVEASQGNNSATTFGTSNAFDPTATAIPQNQSPIYVYPDGSIAPAPNGGSISPRSWGYGDDDQFEGRGNRQRSLGRSGSTTYFDLFGRGE